MARLTTAMQRLRLAYDEYEMSEGFAVVVCVLIWIAFYYVPAMLFERMFGAHISVILE
jgi:hypothetical protein